MFKFFVKSASYLFYTQFIYFSKDFGNKNQNSFLMILVIFFVFLLNVLYVLKVVECIIGKYRNMNNNSIVICNLTELIVRNKFKKLNCYPRIN